MCNEAWSNFRDSINSDKTLQLYEYCLEQFLHNCNLDLESLLKLEQQQLTNLIIKYIGRKIKPTNPAITKKRNILPLPCRSSLEGYFDGSVTKFNIL